MATKAKKRGRSARNSLDASDAPALLTAIAGAGAGAGGAPEGSLDTTNMETESTSTSTTTTTTAPNASEGIDLAPTAASTGNDANTTTSDASSSSSSFSSSSTPPNKHSPETETNTAPATSPSPSSSAAGMPPKARRRGATPTPNPTPAPASTSTSATSTSSSSTSPSDSSPSAAASKKSRKLSSQQSPTQAQAAAMAAIHAATTSNNANATNATNTSHAMNPTNSSQTTATPAAAGATHTHPNTPAGALAAAVANANAASLSYGASATPPPSTDDDADETGDISSSGRGYLAQFFWKEHYNTTRASASDPVPRSTRPNQSEMVPSIPTMFHRVVSVLQEVEWDVTGIDILPLIDRKIVRPLSVRDKTFDKKLLLTSKTGVQYVVQACRKEHVKLLFEGSKGGLLGELGLCPQLIDIYSVSPGRRVCVGGVGPLVREKGVSTTKSTACICAAAEARLRAGLGGNSLPREVIAQANAENARAHYEDDSKANIKGRRTPQPDANGKITPIPGKSVNGLPAGMFPEGDPIFGMDVPDDLLEDMNSLDSTDVDMNGGGGRSSTPLRGRPPTNPDVNTYRRRLAVQNKLVQHLQIQLKQEQEQSAIWRQKWNEEHDLNIRLWDRLNAFQRKLEKMTRPLSSWFYAYSGASTYRSYPLEPWDMENAEAQAQAHAAALAAAQAQHQPHSPAQ